MAIADDIHKKRIDMITKFLENHFMNAEFFNDTNNYMTNYDMRKSKIPVKWEKKKDTCITKSKLNELSHRIESEEFNPENYIDKIELVLK